MPVIHREKIEPFSAQKMYDLVNDVKSYSQFLPWCKDSKVLSESETTMDASVMISKGPLNRWFTTRNTLISGKQIQLNLVDGPFKHLRGSWDFIELEEGGCKVKFKIDFEFSFGPAKILLTPIFESIASSMVNAFSKRAKEIYTLPTLTH